MTITHTTLIRASGGAAMAAGAIFAAVQIGHPKLAVASVATTNVEARDSLKVLMCALTLVGITGMYLRRRKHRPRCTRRRLRSGGRRPR